MRGIFRNAKCRKCLIFQAIPTFAKWCQDNQKIGKTFSLNNGLSPDSVTKGSSKKVWWTCENGHTYEATIANRVHGRGCPICAGKKIIPGINDLATLDLKLESEWNYSKNQGINPHTISPNSHKKAWWICPQGHEWEAEIKSRHHGSGCPYCATIKRKSRSQSEPH